MEADGGIGTSDSSVEYFNDALKSVHGAAQTR